MLSWTVYYYANDNLPRSILLLAQNVLRRSKVVYGQFETALGEYFLISGLFRTFQGFFNFRTVIMDSS